MNFFTITDALCPPNPNVLLKAARTSRFCALLKVKFNRLSRSGSSVKWLMVGGMMSFFTARILAIASIAPAAPSKCPVIDLVELMFNLKACSPKTLKMAYVSAMTPKGVEVP